MSDRGMIWRIFAIVTTVVHSLVVVGVAAHFAGAAHAVDASDHSVIHLHSEPLSAKGDTPGLAQNHEVPEDLCDLYPMTLREELLVHTRWGWVTADAPGSVLLLGSGGPSGRVMLLDVAPKQSPPASSFPS